MSLAQSKIRFLLSYSEDGDSEVVQYTENEMEELFNADQLEEFINGEQVVLVDRFGSVTKYVDMVAAATEKFRDY